MNHRPMSGNNMNIDPIQQAVAAHVDEPTLFDWAELIIKDFWMGGVVAPFIIYIGYLQWKKRK